MVLGKNVGFLHYQKTVGLGIYYGIISLHVFIQLIKKMPGATIV